jgi:hypothetical protein
MIKTNIRRILTSAVSFPFARLSSRSGARGSCGLQCGCGSATTTSELQVLCKGSHELITHRAQSGEVSDVVLVESTAGQHGVGTGEEDI